MLKIKQKKKKSKKIWLIVPILGIFLGGYFLLNTLMPALPPSVESVQAIAEEVKNSKPDSNSRILYIPKMGIKIDIVTSNATHKEAELAALDKGALNRKPSSGNPKDGGNYVIAAHRFSLGWTPEITRKKSPFYHVDKLNIGDEIYIDYDGTRYAYKITKKFNTDAKDIAIEDRSSQPQLTLYTCELSGAETGREVVVAKPAGTITWNNNKSLIKPF